MLMTGKLQLFRLQVQHVDQILEIEQVSFPTPWTKGSFLSELLENTLAYYYGCFQEDRLMGYAGMWIIIDEAHITNVAVHPDYRGKKVGEIIMLHMMTQALERGAYKMTLEVRPSNITAQKLYRRLGFESVGRRKGYYTDNQEDAIIMWKDLTKE